MRSRRGNKAKIEKEPNAPPERAVFLSRFPVWEPYISVERTKNNAITRDYDISALGAAHPKGVQKL
jgi:hypothetical protein